MNEYVLPDRLNLGHKPLYTFEELDIGQAFMNGYNKDDCIKLSRWTYFNLTDNHLGVMTKELRETPSRIFFKCDMEVWLS